MASSDIEQQPDDIHSIMNGRFKSKPSEGKLFLEIIDKLCTQFNGMPFEDILNLFWGESRDTLEKIIKKANKREKKEEATFTPGELKKPSTANILFQKQYKEECDKVQKKFNLKECSEKYKALSDKERAKYTKEAERLKAEYKVEFERLKKAAIANGDFPEEKPKRPSTGYFRFMNETRPKLIEKYKNEKKSKELNNKISTECAEIWNTLDDSIKEKYNQEYRHEKEEFDAKMKIWNEKETARRKKQGNSNENVKDDVKIESSKKVVEEKEPTKNEQNDATDSEAEAEAEAPAPAAPAAQPAPVVKEVTKKKATSAKATSDSEAEIDIPKPKKNVKAKAN